MLYVVDKVLSNRECDGEREREKAPHAYSKCLIALSLPFIQYRKH